MMLQYFTDISTLPSLCFHSPVWDMLSGWITFLPAHCNFTSWQFSIVHHRSSPLEHIKTFVSKWGVQIKEDTGMWEERTTVLWSWTEDQCIPVGEYQVCSFFLSETLEWEVTSSSPTTAPSGMLQSERTALSSVCQCWKKTSFSFDFTLVMA